MATINNLMSGNINTSAIRNTQEQMDNLKNQYKNREIDSDEYREKMSALKDDYSDARMSSVAVGINTANNVSQLFSYMNNSNNGSDGSWGVGTFDTGVFFGSGSELSNLQAMNSARLGIENRARALAGEIARDRARGYDVTDRQEALANLTGNLDILNKNLNINIDRALSDNKSDAKFVDVVSKLREALKPKATDDAEEVDEENAAASASAASGTANGAVENTPAKENAEQAAEALQDDIENAPQNAIEAGVTPANA